MKRTLIEKWFPVKELSRDAAIEMAFKSVPSYIRHCRELGIDGKIGRNFYDPKLRSLHPWFARRPCSVSRAMTLAALLPSNTNKQAFMKAIGWEGKKNAYADEGYPPLVFYTDPDEEFIAQLLASASRNESITVCDPMAGGGAIPLEALRLGFDSIAVDYNPIAALVLKGTLEYPARYGEELATEVEQESTKLISYARESLSSLYPQGCEGYIIARGIKCPHCGGKIPLLSETWISGSNYLQLTVNKQDRTFEASVVKHPTTLPYEGTRAGQISCPYCYETLKRREAYRLWSSEQSEIVKGLSQGVVNDQRILSTHVLMVRQIRRDYVICNHEDERLFLTACHRLASKYDEIKQFIPAWDIPAANEVFTPIKDYGLTSWHELFNPRQLLALGLLTKYVHDRATVLTSTKGNLGAAISLYLALGISRMIDYNSIATSWKRGTIRDTLGRYAQSRKVTYAEEYCEAIVPYRNLEWIYEPSSFGSKRTEGGICPVVRELCKRVGGSAEHIRVLQGDSRFLSSLLADTKVDVINVDPPYFDQHTYSDISEYFWQVIRTAIRPLTEGGYLSQESRLTYWSPTSSSVPREGELIVRRTSAKKEGQEPFGKEWYTEQMSVFFKECQEVIKDDGILLLWFTHRSMDAWEAIVGSLYSGGFYVTKAWPVTSELLTRLVTKGNHPSINQTLIMVCRKRPDGDISRNTLKEHTLDLIEGISTMLQDFSATEHELRVFLKATALCSMTKVPPPLGTARPQDYFKGKLIAEAAKLAEETLPALLERFRARHKQLKLFPDVS